MHTGCLSMRSKAALCSKKDDLGERGALTKCSESHGMLYRLLYSVLRDPLSTCSGQTADATSPPMAVTVKIVLRAGKAKADGTCPLYVRITSNRKSRFSSTGVYLDPRHWNEAKGQVRKTHPLAAALNARLSDLLHGAQTSALEGGTAEAVVGRLSETAGSLSAFFRRYIDGLEVKEQFWEWKKYRVTLGKLEVCFGAEVPFAGFDRHALERFERHLRVKLGNAPNTVLKELQRLRRVIRRAIRDGAVKSGEAPFFSYERPKSEKPDRRKLTLDEIRRLEALELGGSPALSRVRDAFVFAFYGGGVRFSDVVTLRRGSVREGRLEYRMMKTGALVDLPLPPEALRIAARYAPAGDGEAATPFVFPFLRTGEDADPVGVRRRINSHNVQSNEHLKTLAALAGIERPETVSFHVARHSFADFARVKSGDLYAISKALGHANLTITQTYLKSFDRDATDRLTSQLWSDE